MNTSQKYKIYVAAALAVGCLTASAIASPRALGAEPIAQTDATPTVPNITIQADNAPLRSVLKQLFDSAHVSYSISPEVADQTIFLRCTDVSFRQALQMLVQASSPAISYRSLNGVYTIFRRPVASAPVGEMRFVPLANLSPDVVIPLLRSFVSPNAVVVASPQKNGLMVQATPDEFDQITQILRLSDYKTASVVVHANVVYVNPQGKRKLLLTTTLKNVQGQEAVSEQQSSDSDPSQISRFRIAVRVKMLVNSAYSIASRWEIAMPLKNIVTPQVHAQLSKNLTTTTIVADHKTAEIAEMGGTPLESGARIVLELRCDTAQDPNIATKP